MEETHPSHPKETPPGFRWILLALGAVSTGLGCLAVYWPQVSYLYSLVWVGIAFLTLAVVAPRIPPAVLLFLSAISLAFLMSCVVFAWFRLDLLLTVRNMTLSLHPPKVGIWRFDPHYGYSHVPNSSGEQKTPVYHVTYHIDSDSCRVTPDPENPQGVVLCLGCSFTFGTGVEDDEAYPGQLAIHSWPQYKVKNAAVAGWGTAHAFMKIQDAMAQTVAPVLVMYGWIYDHLHRNWIRRGWIRDLQIRPISFGFSTNPVEWRKHPHFEIVEGQLVFEGVIGPENAPEEPPDIDVIEVAITQKMVEEMADLCASRGVPFVFITLPTEGGEPPVPHYLAEVLRANGVWHVDATQAGKGFFANDYHPNTTTHAAIADVIARDERIKEWLGLP